MDGCGWKTGAHPRSGYVSGKRRAYQRKVFLRQRMTYRKCVIPACAIKIPAYLLFQSKYIFKSEQSKRFPQFRHVTLQFLSRILAPQRSQTHSLFSFHTIGQNNAKSNSLILSVPNISNLFIIIPASLLNFPTCTPLHTPGKFFSQFILLSYTLTAPLKFPRVMCK